MQFEDASQTPNVMWHAARAFFENGGTRLYVSRVFRPGTSCNADGRSPTAADYAGNFDSTTNRKTGLKAFEDVDEISVVAAPGITANFQVNSADAKSVINLLIAHAEQMRYRIAAARRSPLPKEHGRQNGGRHKRRANTTRHASPSSFASPFEFFLP